MAVATSVQAGPELDAEIARCVFGQVECDGWRRTNLGSAGGPAMIKQCEHADGACYPKDVGWIGRGPMRYSTDIAAAWQVVERMRGLGHVIRLEWSDPSLNEPGEQYWSGLIAASSFGAETDLGRVFARADADTAPLAICKVALAVFGAEVRNAG